jgi:hypothetical protein
MSGDDELSKRILSCISAPTREKETECAYRVGLTVLWDLELYGHDNFIRHSSCRRDASKIADRAHSPLQCDAFD